MATLLVVGVITGCSSDTTAPALLPDNQRYASLTLNWRAINMALTTPYDTVQLVAIPRTAAGALLATDSIVHYKALDSNVTVTDAGLVTAHYVTTQTQVIATLTANGITQTDTAIVRVTETPFPAPLATLSIQPQPGDLDSARVAVNKYYSINQFNGNVPVYATLANGDSVCRASNFGCPFLVRWSTSDPTIATLDQNGVLNALGIGRVTFYASTLAYGVPKQDSLPFVIGYPLLYSMQVNSYGISHQVPYLVGSGATMGVHGRFVLGSSIPYPVEYSFPYQTQMIQRLFPDDPAQTYQLVDTLPAVGPDGLAVSGPLFQFDSAGTYSVHCRVLGGDGGSIDGTIIVSDGP